MFVYVCTYIHICVRRDSSYMSSCSNSNPKILPGFLCLAFRMRLRAVSEKARWAESSFAGRIKRTLTRRRRLLGELRL